MNPDLQVDLASTGKAFVFNGNKPGKTVLFRAELDALPIQEQSALSYRSVHDGASHACGHDGHMAIVAGLAEKVSRNNEFAGKVVFLFQPAEEVEQGARDVVEDPKFKELEPDFVFALHNIPGIPQHSIVIREGSFSAASKGMTVKLFGKTSHAAEPENGISPANAISRIIQELHALIENKNNFDDLTLLTIIHIELGTISFGTTPGYAEIRITLRSFENRDMELLTHKTVQIIEQIGKDERLKTEIFFSEEFPATVNDSECVGWLKQSVAELNLKALDKTEPFKWSEDFAYFTQSYPGALFGLGSGVKQAQLHHPNFNFPDEIIETGINVFYHTLQKIQETHER